MYNDEKTEKHPSYVKVGFSRRQGNPGRLFGSALPQHQTYITLSVTPATQVTRNGESMYFGGLSGQLIEVDLSPVQFAELLTSMNVGTGVPGTLRRIQNVPVERPPSQVRTEVEDIRAEFKTRLKEVSEKLKEGRVRAREILEKKGALTKSEKEEIESILRTTDKVLLDYGPYLVDRFQEATSRVVTAAKSEIDSFVTHNVIAEGIKSLMKKASEVVPQLPTYVEGDK